MTAEIQRPHLPRELTPLDGPELVDETEWNDVRISGDLGGPMVVTQVDISSSTFSHARLTGRLLERVCLVDVLFEDCELSGTTFSDASFTRVELRRCRMSGFVAAELKARHVHFADCKAGGANFRRSVWDRVEFDEVDLAEADFHGASLPGARFLGCDLTRAEFSKATVPGAALHGSVLEGIRGGDHLRGVVIASDQMLSLAVTVYAALGIRVDDELDPPRGGGGIAPPR